MLLKKFTPLQNDVIFIDGLWGTGKSILGPIVSGMEKVEKIKFEHIYEYIAILRHLNRITEDAAACLLNTYADLSQYNNVVGREINLRWGDDSGFANNPNSFRYLKRLFSKEGERNISDINKNNIGLNIMSHLLLLVADPIFETFGNRAKIIEVVRHPLYMVNHWYSYLQRFDSPREFTPSFDYQGNKVPWFVSGWEEGFAQASLMDKALLSIIRLYEWLDNALQRTPNVLTLSFESLVMTPDESLSKLSLFLGRKHYPGLPKILRKQKIPRKTISQGKGHAAYGWSKDTKSSELEVYSRQMEFVKKEGSNSIVNQFLVLIETYNKQYPSVLSEYQS